MYLTYTTSRGHALIDRSLYLPKSWSDDVERRAEAGVPEEVEFVTKPTLAKQMILRALDGGAPAKWVAGDEVYGADPCLRKALENRGVGYVLAVSCSHPVNTAAGKRRADEITARLPKYVWQRLSAGAGSKGQRLYDWAWITIDRDDEESPGQRWLLVRRNTSTSELAFYRCFTPNSVPLGHSGSGRRTTLDRGGVIPGQ